MQIALVAEASPVAKPTIARGEQSAGCSALPSPSPAALAISSAVLLLAMPEAPVAVGLTNKSLKPKNCEALTVPTALLSGLIAIPFAGCRRL